MATTAGISTPPSPLPLPSTASALWARVLDHRGSSTDNVITAQPPSYAQFMPQDKTGTSTRMLLHDTHARLEFFSERANLVFSEIEASKREIVRVREDVESAREQELDTIAQLSMFPMVFFAHICLLSCANLTNTHILYALVNRCQSSLQKAIGEPVQSREVTMMQASVTVSTERLHALEDKINSKIDSLTVLLQAQTQLTQSLQEQFSRVQTQQSQILELLVPLHPILQSVPLHINLARNAILEKIPEGCSCTNDCTGGLIPPTQRSCQTLSSQESTEPPWKVRKRMRTNHLDKQNRDPRGPFMNRYEDQPAVEGPARKPGDILTLSRPQRTGSHCGVQAPSSGMSGIGGVFRSDLRNANSVSGHTALASKLSTNSRGIAPSFILVLTLSMARASDKERIRNPSRVPVTAVQGKRFILFDDDDDDDDEF